MDKKIKINDTIVIGEKELTKQYVESLSYEERKDLIEPIFKYMRKYGFPKPDKNIDLNQEFNKLVNIKFNLNEGTLFNNSSLGNYICLYFCWNIFYSCTDKKSKNKLNLSVMDVFYDDEKLKSLIFNRLGGDWFIETVDKKTGNTLPPVNEAFRITPQQMITGARSKRLAPSISMFKPTIAKFIYQKYSQEGDTVFDYSAGFGGRLLGAMSCNRKYIGVDPLTISSLNNMVEYFQFQNVQLIDGESENVNLGESTIDFSFSSPPYYDQEFYSKNLTQAYNKGREYFYDVYWKKTLENIKIMLKPNKYFGLNILNKYTQMIDMAKEQFGEPIEIVSLRTVRSHLTKNKNTGTEKYEPVFIFRNIKE